MQEPARYPFCIICLPRHSPCSRSSSNPRLGLQLVEALNARTVSHCCHSAPPPLDHYPLCIICLPRHSSCSCSSSKSCLGLQLVEALNARTYSRCCHSAPPPLDHYPLCFLCLPRHSCHSCSSPAGGDPGGGLRCPKPHVCNYLCLHRALEDMES